MDDIDSLLGMFGKHYPIDWAKAPDMTAINVQGSSQDWNNQAFRHVLDHKTFFDPYQQHPLNELDTTNGLSWREQLAQFKPISDELKNQAKTEFKEPDIGNYELIVKQILFLQNILIKFKDEIDLHTSLGTLPKFDIFIRVEAIRDIIESKRKSLIELYNIQLKAAKEFYENDLQK